MSKNSRAVFGSNLICICIDRMDNEDYSGVIWNQYEEEPRSFEGSMDLMQKMDDYMDALRFPQRSTMPRTFTNKEASALYDIPQMDVDKVMDTSNFDGKHGEIATFIVRVKFRQNATWQGETLWVEKEQTAGFLSALELMKLIDGAVSVSKKP